MSLQQIDARHGGTLEPPLTQPSVNLPRRTEERLHAAIRRRRAAEQRRRDEQDEARALGVEVVERDLTITSRWNEAEDAVIQALYPDYKRIRDRLPHRTHVAIGHRVIKLGVGKTLSVWSSKDVATLRSIYAKSELSDLLACFPGKGRQQIYNKAHEIGVKRGHAPLKLTGNWLCDAIRDRCRELGYTMQQLDAMARTHDYFTEMRWKLRAGHIWLPMVKAAKALGGELRVEWPD